MGQTITRLFSRSPGREADASVLSDHCHDRNEETLSYLDRYQKFCRKVFSLLRRLLGRGARKPPSGTGKPPPGGFSFYPYYKEEKTCWSTDQQYGTAALPRHNYSIDTEIAPAGAGKPPPVTGKPSPDRSNSFTCSSADQHSRGCHYPVDDYCIDIEIDPVNERHVVLECGVVVDNEGDDVVVVAKSMDEGPLPRWGALGPYNGSQRILLVGEGDFSFSASLAAAFGDASNMLATSLDSFEFLITNYKRALANIFQLTSRMCMVMHGVDATKMVNHPQLASLKFDCIVYNFPHAGFSNRSGPQDAQIRMHQQLVRGFMANAKKMIKVDGQIHITHKCCNFFLDWDLETLGLLEGLLLVDEAPFNFRDYPGYHTKFGYGGDTNFNCNPSKTYKFQLALPKKRRRRRKGIRV